LIGVALQQAALDPLMTPRELLDLQGALYRLSRAQTARRRDELLERLDLATSSDKRVMTLSGGMRRRLDLAMSLIGSPRVLFLDEPTTGLDPISRRAVWAEVRRLNDAGTTVFLTTQYLEEADQLAHRVGFINRGRISREGTPDTLKRQMGKTRLKILVTDGRRDEAIKELASFGDVQADDSDWVVVALRDGAPAVPAAMRALDESDIAVGDVDVQQPTLDDVFLSLTGDHLDTGGGSRATAKA
jgi:ABC-2 type transport system ATP-binding protein